MNQIWTVAKKELRGFFHSPVAIIFLAVFLVATLGFFFFVDRFFARGVADLRPLFDRLPLLLIFLVAALTMRMWSEEQKLGTLEVLLTLPIPRWMLVAGKFLAGMILVGLALGLTLGIPVTVSLLGDVDWGPIAGGYLAALLLAAAYLAIGLCVSAMTDNQIVSLALTITAGLVLYLVGAAPVLEAAGYPTSEVLRSIGTGSRFESVARGVLDLRDLIYWLSLIGFFLVLNVLILKSKSWSAGARTAPKRRGALIALGLLLANAVALNLWLAPIHSLRFDLTEDKEYSLSEATREIVNATEGPLLIRGYFTRETHPLLAPLVSQVSDRLREYKAIGGGNVRVEFVDPSEDEEIQKEALEKYGIESFPVEYGDRNKVSEVNAFFSILVKYGDQQEVLNFPKIATVVHSGVTDIDVRLGNLEYELTKSIKKVAFGFQSMETLLATLPSPPELTFYVTKDALPEELKTSPQTIAEVVAELEKDLGGTINYTEVTPQTAEEQQALFDSYQLRPFFGGVYLHLLLKVGDQLIRVVPPRDMNKAGVKETLTEALKRAAPGFVKTIGMVVPPAPPTPQQPQFPGAPPPRPQPPPQSFQSLQQRLTAEHEVQQVDLSSGRVGDNIDVLIVAGPEALPEASVKAIDQFVMRGGSLIVLAGRYRLKIDRGRLGVQKLETGLEGLLASYGVDVAAKLVKDVEVESFPVPVQKDIGGGLAMRDFKRLPYPFFVRVGDDQLADHLTTAPLSAVVAHFSSPLSAMTPQASSGDDKADIAVEKLLSSSGEAWLQEDTEINPNFERFGEAGFGRPDEISVEDKGPHTLAMTLTGTFVSHFAASPPAEDGKANQDAEPLIPVSPAGTRVVVIGSSSLVDDVIGQVAAQARATDVFESNINFVVNLVDWALADTQLLTIRSRGSHTRTLDLDDDGGGRWEIINYAIALVALGLFIGLTLLRRGRLRPFSLDSAARAGWTSGGPGASGASGVASASEETPPPAAATSDEEEE